MQGDRVVEVLTAGLRAAHNKMFMPKNLKKGEYPRNFKKLYSLLEDEIYELYLGIEHHNWQNVYEEAGDVVAFASMIAELADNIIKGRESSNEVAGN